MKDGPVRPGDILAGKYRVERVLGAGNMGVVVAATHIELGQLVALKLMLSGKAAFPEQGERFLREARAAVRLRSQHVARVLDVGTHDNESPYIVMEFMEGMDLAALLRERTALPVEEAVEYVLQACEAIGEAHAAGIVHRDLKPANLFLTEDVGGLPCVKVLDFGVSKLAGAGLSLTHETQSLGSPLYMSPEQINSAKSADARSDLWALGVILYQLVAGWTPFHGQTIEEVFARVLFGEPTPLRAHRNDIPPGFEALILRCLERDRNRRFRDVDEFAAALVPYAPTRARVYAHRVARALGGLKARPSAASSPDVQPAAHRASAPALPIVPLGSASPGQQVAPLLTADTPTTSAPVNVSRVTARLPPVASTLVLPPPAPPNVASDGSMVPIAVTTPLPKLSAPPALASSAPDLVSDTSLTVASSQSISSQPLQTPPVKLRRHAALAAACAVVGFTAVVAIFVVFRVWEPRTESAPAPTALPSSVVPEPLAADLAIASTAPPADMFLAPNASAAIASSPPPPASSSSPPSGIVAAKPQEDAVREEVKSPSAKPKPAPVDHNEPRNPRANPPTPKSGVDYDEPRNPPANSPTPKSPVDYDKPK